MSTAARDVSRFILPVRVQARQARDDSLAARLALADRIADLPGIHATDHDPNGGSWSVDVFVTQGAPSIRKQRPAKLLCRIGHDGIVAFGLSNADRHQVLSRGWGRPHGDGVMLFLPRDEDELEMAWDILFRAYETMMCESAAAIPVRTAWFDGMPSFSRTNLN